MALTKRRRMRCSSVPLFIREGDEGDGGSPWERFTGGMSRFVQVGCGCGWRSKNFDMPAQLASWGEHKQEASA